MTDVSTQDDSKVAIKITDIYAISQAMEVAIKRKVFTEDEIKQIYPSWNSVIRFCEDVKRKTEIEEIYKQVKNQEETLQKKQLESVEEETSIDITPS